MSELWKEVKTKAKANEILNTKRIVHLFYYSGHGVESNTVSMVLDDSEAKKRYYSLEHNFGVISKTNKHYCIIMFFDCCREYMDKRDMREFKIE